MSEVTTAVLTGLHTRGELGSFVGDIATREIQLPCADQTSAVIERWLRTHVRPGAEVVVRYTIGWRVRYQRGRVARAAPERITVAMRRSDGEYDRLPRAGFHYSGRSCWNPGSSHLVIPTPAVLSACDACEGTPP